MKVTILSPDMGPVTFHAPDDGGYVRVYCSRLNWQNRQPCSGGGFRGSTLMAMPENFERVTRNWWGAYRNSQRRWS